LKLKLCSSQQDKVLQQLYLSPNCQRIGLGVVLAVASGVFTMSDGEILASTQTSALSTIVLILKQHTKSMWEREPRDA
jgi:hypothetical protein